MIATIQNKPKSRVGRWAWIGIGSLIPLLGVLGVLSGIAYLKYSQIQAAMSEPPPPETPITVNLATATPHSFRRSTVAVGSVLAPQSVRLRNELTGVVTEVHMQPGQMVRKGDVLVQFDVRAEQAELKAAKASNQRATSALKRAEKLVKTNTVSAQELEAVDAARIQAEAEVERLQVMIDKKTLRAPFDARAGLFQLHAGQYLEAGTEITTLEGVDNYLDVDFSLPAHVADGISLGDEVRIQTSDSTTQVAKVIALDSHADAVSRLLLTRARLHEPPPTLQPQDSVRVMVEFGQQITAQSVPATSIRRGPTGTNVYVASHTKGEMRAESRDVVVVGGDGVHSWVANGLSSNEQVVADGSFKVFPGALLTDAHQTDLPKSTPVPEAEPPTVKIELSDSAKSSPGS